MKARLFVTHGQFAIFSSELASPFNDWQEQHVRQGFAWRAGSVSFATLRESGDHEFIVALAEGFAAIERAAVRVFEVPFEAARDAVIEIASISDSAPLPIPAGRYQLRAELFAPDQAGVSGVKITFVKCDEGRFAVPVHDDALSPGEHLLVTAQPA